MQGCGNTGGIPDVPARRSPLASLGKHPHFKSQRDVQTWASGRAQGLPFLPRRRLQRSYQTCAAAELDRPGAPRPARASGPGLSPGPALRPDRPLGPAMPWHPLRPTWGPPQAPSAGHSAQRVAWGTHGPTAAAAAWQGSYLGATRA